MNWFKRILEDDWDIVPAGGLTGDAYVAEKNDRRLFLKRNSSPFLAVLSAEGIVPKLIWTKRLENGDVITAQEFLAGRELEPQEMQDNQVADLLYRIHNSSELLHMLMRLGKKVVEPDIRYSEIYISMHGNELFDKDKEVEIALNYLKKLLPATFGQKPVVCHGDLNHHNLIRTTEDKIYLIDWDNACIADPITDFGMVLKRYIPVADWDHWLQEYGVVKDDQLIKRMYWYLLIDTLQYLNWHAGRGENDKVIAHLSDLQILNKQVETIILD